MSFTEVIWEPNDPIDAKGKLGYMIDNDNYLNSQLANKPRGLIRMWNREDTTAVTFSSQSTFLGATTFYIPEPSRCLKWTFHWYNSGSLSNSTDRSVYVEFLLDGAIFAGTATGALYETGPMYYSWIHNSPTAGDHTIAIRGTVDGSFPPTASFAFGYNLKVEDIGAAKTAWTP